MLGMYCKVYLMEQLAHASSHGEVERSQSLRVSGHLTGSSSQKSGGYIHVVVETGIMKCSSFMTTSTTVNICLYRKRKKGKMQTLGTMCCAGAFDEHYSCNATGKATGHRPLGTCRQSQFLAA